MKLPVPFFKQDTLYTCGPTSLQMVLAFFHDIKSEEALSSRTHADPEVGTRHMALIEAAQKEGFYCYVHDDSSIDEITSFLKLGLPVIVHFTEPVMQQGHYSVVTAIEDNHITFNDPWFGKNFKMPIKEFNEQWHSTQVHQQYKKWIMVISKESFELGKQYLPIAH